MYEIIKNVITSDRYELSDMLVKIDTIWLQGDLTDAERENLVTMAQDGADATNSIQVMQKLEELDKRVKELEDAAASDSGDSEDTETTAPEYEAGKWYYTGDLVTFEGKTYKCIAPEGVVCVWSPKEYPTYWELVTE